MRLVKIGIASVNSTVGAVRSNVDRCVRLAHAMAEEGTTIALFPEQVIGGYAMEDLVQWRGFVAAQRRELARFAYETQAHGTVFVLGVTVGLGGDLFNCGALVHRGRVLGFSPKEKLPTYNIFYEGRTFSRGTPYLALDADGVFCEARCCGARISARYPLVEAIGGVLSLAVLEAVVFRLDPLTSAPRALFVYLADFALCLSLVAAAFIDLEHMYISNWITIGGTVLGVGTAQSFRGLSIADVLIGAAVGFVVVWLPFVFIYPRLRGRAGMGLGDAKLLMLAGAWFGWQGALFVLGAGAVQGTMVAIPLVIFKGKIEEPEAVKREREEIQQELAAMTPEERAEAERELAVDPLADEPGEGIGQARIAFGPFLALAIIEYLLFGRQLMAAWLGPP